MQLVKVRGPTHNWGDSPCIIKIRCAHTLLCTVHVKCVGRVSRCGLLVKTQHCVLLSRPTGSVGHGYLDCLGLRDARLLRCACAGFESRQRILNSLCQLALVVRCQLLKQCPCSGPVFLLVVVTGLEGVRGTFSSPCHPYRHRVTLSSPCHGRTLRIMRDDVSRVRMPVR